MANKKTRRGSRGGKKIKEQRVVNQEEGVVVKVLEFGGDDALPDRGESKQLTPDVFEVVIKDGQAIRPLYDPLLWATLLEQDVRLFRCVTAMALNTVGSGWELSARYDSKEFVEENKENIKKERAEIMPLFKYPNSEYSFEEMMQMIKTDEEAEGQGYMEVSRDNKGQIDGLYHAPGHTIRVLAEKKGFLQMRTNLGSDSYVFSPGKTAEDSIQKVYFKNFGDKRAIDNRTGGEAKGALAPEFRANELIQFKIYTPRSSFYGIPRVVAAAPAISGNRLAQLRNVSFFENDATPRLAVIVEGGNLDTSSVKMIENFIEARGKGPMNFGRVMVLQPQSQEAVPGAESKAKITLMPLTVGVTEDASFTRYLVLNSEMVREAFGIGKIFLGTADDVNRATALTMKQVTMEQVFEPEIKRYEHRLDITVMRDLGAKYTQLRFTRPKMTDLSSDAQAYGVLAAAGGITPNDIKELLGQDPFAAEWGNTPIPLIKMGLLEGREVPADFADGPDSGGEGNASIEQEIARATKLFGEATGFSGTLNLIANGDPQEVVHKLRALVEK